MEPWAKSEEREDPAVTVSITHQVRPGREPDFDRYLRGIGEAASRFPGYVSARVFRSVRGDARYRVVLRFEHESDLRRWLESEDRASMAPSRACWWR